MTFSPSTLFLVGAVCGLAGLVVGVMLMRRTVETARWRAYQDAIADETRARVIHREKPDALVLARAPSDVLREWTPDALKPGPRGMRCWGDE